MTERPARRNRSRQPSAVWAAGDGGEAPSGEVTAVKVRKGRPDRALVHFVDGPALELATVVVQEAGVRKGFVLSSEDAERLLAADEPHRARSRALKILSGRDRAVAELQSRLSLLGFSPEVVGETVRWLEGLGYLDDRRFAERYAAEKLAGGWGDRRVRAELARLGVERALVDDVLALASSDEDAVNERDDALLRAARRRFGAQFATDPVAAARRLAGFLARRGYSWQEVERVSAVLRAELDQERDPENSATDADTRP